MQHRLLASDARPPAAPEPGCRAVHVLHVVSGDLWGGAEALVLELARALQDLPGVRVSAVVMNPGRLAESLAQAGVATTVLDESRLSSMVILRRLTGLIRRLRPDVVHTHRRKENVLGGIAARLAGIPSVRTVHGEAEFVEPLLRLDKQAYALLDRLSARTCQAAVIAVSPELAGRLAKRHSTKPVCVIRNGISAERVRAAAATEPDLPDVGTQIRLAYLGRLVPVKRVDRLLHALKLLLGSDPGRYSLFLIGDGPERESLVQLTAALDVSAHVHFLGERADAAACLARMDMLLLASEHEGLPMAVLEALCVGVLPIVPPVGGLPELLQEADAGCLAESASPEHIARAVRKAKVHTTRSKNGGRIPQQWTVEHAALQHLQLYRTLQRRYPPRNPAVAGGQQ